MTAPGKKLSTSALHERFFLRGDSIVLVAWRVTHRDGTVRLRFPVLNLNVGGDTLMQRVLAT